MYELVSIIITVFGVLQIILFFKIWGMTNDIREIKKKYLTEKREEKTTIHNLAVGNSVIERKTGRRMTITAINSDGSYKCNSENGVCLGNFSKDDLSF